MPLALGEPIAYGAFGIEQRLRLAQRYAPWDGLVVLDAGCGNGAYALELCRQAKRVIALDLQVDHLRSLRAQCQQQGIENIDIVWGSVEDLPLAANVFDQVFLIEVLEHVGCEEVALAELRRVLKEGAKALLFVPNHWYPFETHGAALPLPKTNRIPFFISWLPKGLHDRIAYARIYGKGDIEALLRKVGFRQVNTDYLLPPLDKIGNPVARGLLRRILLPLQKTPLRRFGVSILAIGTA